MDQLTDTIVSQILASLDPTPVNPNKEEQYLAFLVCKNLCDLCETGAAILDDIKRRGYKLNNMPEISDLNMCRAILQKFYSDSMFIEDEEYGARPNWNAVASFSQNRTVTAYRIYRAIRNNAVDCPDSKEIHEAVRQRNEKFFIEKYDQLFEYMPFREALSKFKNMLNCPYVQDDHRSYVWDFFDSLLDLFIYEQEHIDDLKSL